MRNFNNISHAEFKKCGEIMLAVQSNKLAMACNFCQKIFVQLQTFMKHLRLQHNDKLKFVKQAKEVEIYTVEELMSDTEESGITGVGHKVYFLCEEDAKWLSKEDLEWLDEGTEPNVLQPYEKNRNNNEYNDEEEDLNISNMSILKALEEYDISHNLKNNLKSPNSFQSEKRNNLDNLLLREIQNDWKNSASNESISDRLVCYNISEDKNFVDFLKDFLKETQAKTDSSNALKDYPLKALENKDLDFSNIQLEEEVVEPSKEDKPLLLEKQLLEKENKQVLSLIQEQSILDNPLDFKVKQRPIHENANNVLKYQKTNFKARSKIFDTQNKNMLKSPNASILRESNSIDLLEPIGQNHEIFLQQQNLIKTKAFKPENKNFNLKIPELGRKTLQIKKKEDLKQIQIEKSEILKNYNPLIFKEQTQIPIEVKSSLIQPETQIMRNKKTESYISRLQQPLIDKLSSIKENTKRRSYLDYKSYLIRSARKKKALQRVRNIKKQILKSIESREYTTKINDIKSPLRKRQKKQPVLIENVTILPKLLTPLINKNNSKGSFETIEIKDVPKANLEATQLDLSESVIDFLQRDLKANRLNIESLLNDNLPEDYTSNKTFVDPNASDTHIKENEKDESSYNLINDLLKQMDKEQTPKEKSQMENATGRVEALTSSNIDDIKDIELLAKFGLKIIKLPEIEDDLSLEQRDEMYEKAITFAKLYKKWPRIWSPKNIKISALKQELYKNFNQLLFEINLSFNLDLSIMELKRLVNLINTWYAQNFNRKLIEKQQISVSTNRYLLMFHYIPKTIKHLSYCEYCEEYFSTEHKYFNHRITHTGASFPYSCQKCFVGFKTLRYLKSHEQSCNLIVNTHHKCPVCTNMFVTTEQLYEHSKTHLQTIYSCAKCKLVFASFMDVQNHMALCN